MRRVICVLLAAACSNPTPRPQLPVSAPPPIAVATPAAVPMTPAAPAIAMKFADGDPGFAFADPARRKKLEAAFPAIDKLIDDEVKAQKLAGIAIGIVIDGELSYAKGFGVTDPETKTPVTADTVYRIGSITKSFTALTLLALRDDGVLGLEDPLAKWVPEAATLVYPSRDAQPITLRQLANHTSGLQRGTPAPPEVVIDEAFVTKHITGMALEFVPGTSWSYSNLGFGLLGMAVAHAAKQSYHDVVDAKLLRPLGMTSTVWDDKKVTGKLAPVLGPGPKEPARLGAVDGAGAIYSNVRDMAKYVAFQLATYPPRNDADSGPIKRATVREAHRTGVGNGRGTYGFGWSREEKCAFGDVVAHNGAIDSHRAEVVFAPSRGVGVISLTNAGEARDLLARKILDELAKTGALEPRIEPPHPKLDGAMRALLGVYEQWDEAALAKALSRPRQPEEKDELAGYRALHGKCTDIKLARLDASTRAAFAVTCERGKLEVNLAINQEGRIDGFIGFSRGVTPPADVAKTNKAVIGLIAKWDDKVFAKHLAKTRTAEQVKAMLATFRERHGACKVGGAVHEGFDWGHELTCAKENVTVMVGLAPNDPATVTTINLSPIRGEKPLCKD